MQVTDEETAFLIAYRSRESRFQEWLGGRTSYNASEVPADLSIPSNEERSKAEVIRFKAEPLEYGKPYGAYLSRRDGKSYIATWMGDPLATVKAIRSFRPPRNWLTDERGSFWAKGIDGRVYYGRHNGFGMHCTLRLAKYQGVL